MMQHLQITRQLDITTEGIQVIDRFLDDAFNRLITGANKIKITNSTTTQDMTNAINAVIKGELARLAIRCGNHTITILSCQQDAKLVFSVARIDEDMNRIHCGVSHDILRSWR